MYLKHLSLTNFRSFARLDMDIPRHTLLLVGDNAQGKTSILEAIYFLATFTSLQASHDRQLINFLVEDEPIKVGRLVADLQRGEQSHRLEVRLILDANAVNGARLRKEILVDGVKRSLQEALGIFNAVIFLPQMTRIIEGGPEERRKYLNLGLSQVYPGYARALTEYAQLITRRNALLKQLGERGGDPDQLIYWDNLLTQRGALIVKARLTALAGLNHLAGAVHDRLSSGLEVLQLLYKPSVQPLAEENAQASFLSADFTEDSDEDSIRRAFAQQLRNRRSEEIARGVTVCGPHRDDFRFVSNGVDLGDFGSRGQVRTALLALKLAEVSWMRARTGEWPVLLLDETLAELDPQRRTDLMTVLQECDQAVLTTTDLSQFAEPFLSECAIWQVRSGSVQHASAYS